MSGTLSRFIAAATAFSLSVDMSSAFSAYWIFNLSIRQTLSGSRFESGLGHVMYPGMPSNQHTCPVRLVPLLFVTPVILARPYKLFCDSSSVLISNLPSTSFIQSENAVLLIFTGQFNKLTFATPELMPVFTVYDDKLYIRGRTK